MVLLGTSLAGCGLLVLGLTACGFITDAARDARWDIDRDGVERPMDCDDRDPRVSPWLPETCDARGVDEDCDGKVDDADSSVTGGTPWCRDADGDGDGDLATLVTRCDAEPGWVAGCGDCDDGDPTDACDPTPPTVPTCLTPEARLSVSALVGDAGVTSFVADGSASTGEELEFTFYWVGPSSGEKPGGASALHVYHEPGYYEVALVVENACGAYDADRRWVAVSDGGLLTVTAEADEDDPEVGPPWLGAGLSLREALKLAQTAAGTQVVTFDPTLAVARTGTAMPYLSDEEGILIGAGTTLDGSDGGRIAVTGKDAVVAGLVLVDFVDPLGAVQLTADRSRAQDLAVSGSRLGVRLDGKESMLLDATLVGGTDDPQVDVRGDGAQIVSVEVAGGAGTGIAVGAKATQVQLCRVHDQVGSGITVARDMDDVRLVDSTIVGNGGDGIAVDDQRVDRLEVRNVVIADNGGWGLAGGPISFQTGSPDFVGWYGNLLGDCGSCGGLGSSSVLADPELVDWASGDLTPRPTSPLIDAGTAATGVDRNGPCPEFWLGAAPDIGAIEVR